MTSRHYLRIRAVFPGLFCLGLLAGSAYAQSAPVSSPVGENYARLPLAFEKQGERFVARGQGYAVGLDGGKAAIGVVASDKSARTVSVEFAGSRPSPRAVPGPELPGKVNYYRGNDPRKWQIGLPTYARIAYPDAYPGIDVVYYGNQQQLEFDVVIKPGADPEAIRMKVGGAGKLSIDGSGTLNLGEAAGGLQIALPQIYQEVSGVRKSVPGRYAIVGRDEVAFKVDPWDRTRPLVIDPTIVYSVLFGGGLSVSSGEAIGLDSSADVLIAGYTWAADFPTLDAFQNHLKGGGNAFVTKINPTGTAFLYSTFFGGSSFDAATGMAIDSTGAAWVTGSTASSNFPVLNAAHATYGGGLADGFVARFNSAGVLQFSTFLGGNANEYGAAIAVDSLNNGYVTGFTQSSGTSFPTTAGVVNTTNPGQDAFVEKYGSAGAVVYSTLLGGGNTSGSAIAVDSLGDAYVAGTSSDSSFTGAPSGGAQTTNSGNGDAFVAKLNPTAAEMSYFTFLGGTEYDNGTAIAVDTLFNAYVGGQTSSTGLATAGAAQTVLQGGVNGFAAKLNPSGSQFTYVTYLGGARADKMTGLALEGSPPNVSVYLAGTTDSANFPTVAPLQSALYGDEISLFSSTNSGSSFSAFDSNIPGAVSAVSINPAGTSTVVLTESGIYRTVNGGASWTRQFSVPPFPYASLAYVARSPVATGTLYAMGGSSNYIGNGLTGIDIYQSTDDGQTWTHSGKPSGSASGIVADPLTANTVYLFSGNSPYVSKSTDGGATWNPAGAGLAGQVEAMAATTDGALYAGTFFSGIYKSTNQGGSWTAVNNGLPASCFSLSNFLSASGTTVYAACQQVYITTNGGSSWAVTLAGQAGNIGAVQVAVSPQNPSVLYAATENGTVLESSNGGATWSSPGTGLPADLPFFFTPPLVVDPSNSAHVLVTAPVYYAGFLAKLNSAGSALTWSTYLAGTASAVATDGAGDAFLTGFGFGGGFPITSSALPSGDIFVTKISDATAPCTFAVSPSSALASQGGGTLTFSVVAPSGCAWTATTNEPWAVVTAGASGTGTEGFVTVQTSANSDSATESATLTVGSQQITITEPSNSCVYPLNVINYSVAAAGGTISAFLAVTAGCPWAITNPYASAISFTSASSGTGSAAIVLTVTPNLTSQTLNFNLPISGSPGNDGAEIQIEQAAAGSTATQTIQFDAIPNQILGISPFPIAAEATSLLPVGFVSTTTTVCKMADDLVMLLKAGTCSITASQPGNASYIAATSVTRSFVVSQANPSTAFLQTSASPYPAGSFPSDVVVGDFNNDGIPDLAVSDNIPPTVQIFFGDGKGNFTADAKGPFTPFTTGSEPTMIVVGDFNGDGNLDIASANYGGNSVTVLLGDGTGGFTQSSNSPFAVGQAPTDLVTGDFNGDGIQDLVVTNSQSNDFSVLLGDGTGNFQPAPGSPVKMPFPAPTGGAFQLSPDAPAVGDFNGDGIQDLAVTGGYQENNVAIFLGNGSGGFSNAPGSPYATGSFPYDVLVADFNGDGNQDLAINNGGDTTVTVLLGNGLGGFTPAPGSPVSAGGPPTVMIAGDFNGDGIPDLAIGIDVSYGNGLVAENTPLTILLGNGAGGFAPSPASPMVIQNGAGILAVADFNGDGIEDLATANILSNDLVILLGFKNGSTAQSITFAPLSNVTYGVQPFTISASATSGLAVTFLSTTPTACGVAGNSVTIFGGGPCTIVASQAGNATYAAAATVAQSFTVLATQTISFGLLNDQALNGSAPPPLSATASSGLTVAYTSNSLSVCTVSTVYITLLTAGTCSITASQPGNATYTAAPSVTQTFTVSVAGIQPVAGFLDQNGAPALTFNNSTNFPDAGGFLIAAPGVTQDLNGNAYVVGLDSLGGVHLNSYNFANSAWNGWQYSGGILDTSSGLSAAVDPSGVVWFAGRDIGERYWINSWNGTNFSGWTRVTTPNPDGPPLDGIFAANSVPQIAITADGTVWIIGTDIGGRVWSNSYNPSSQTFTGWVDRQGVIYGQPSATAGQDGFVYVAVRNVASESPIYITQIPAGNAANAAAFLNGGGQIDTDPVITSQNGTVSLLAEADGNTVYLLTFAEATQSFLNWSFTGGILNSATIAAAAGNVYVAGLDSADRIYWYSVTGNSWFLAGGAGISSTVLSGGK